jgi:hypothetical protein
MSTPQLHSAAIPLMQRKPIPVAQTGLVHIAPGLLGKTSRLRLLMFWIVGLMGFLAVILVVLHLGSLQKMAELIRSARPGWMLVALAVQCGTYVSAAFVWRVALRQAGHPLALRTLIPLGIAKVFTDQVLPSGGISGTMLVVRGLTGRHVPAGIAMAAMLVGMVSYDIAYLFVVLASTGVLWLQHRLNVALIAGVAIFVVVTVTVPAAVLGLKQWGSRAPIAWPAAISTSAIDDATIHTLGRVPRMRRRCRIAYSVACPPNTRTTKVRVRKASRFRSKANLPIASAPVQNATRAKPINTPTKVRCQNCMTGYHETDHQQESSGNLLED